MLRLLFILAIAGAGLIVRPPVARAQENPFSNCKPDDSVWSQGSLPEAIPERPGARRQTWTGSKEQPVRITCNDTVLQALQVVYEDDTRLIHAAGDVLVTQPDLTLFAERADLNGITKLGTFYNASGLARITKDPVEKSQFGSIEPDVIFHAERIEKTGPRTYRLHGGGFTTCAQASPRWEMTGSHGTIVLDKRAVLRNVVLKVKDVPLLYLPAIYYPINKEERSTGFLLPTYGSSASRGTNISNAFFLVLGRSQDATFFHDWYSKTGQGVGTQYRFISSPDSRGEMNFHLVNEHGAQNGTAPVSTSRAINLDGNLNQGFAHGLRLSGQMVYFNSLSTQQNYQDINRFSNSSRSFNLALTGGVRRYRFSAIFDQRDYFQGADVPGQRTGRTPVINASISEKPIGKSRVYIGATSETAYLVNQADLSKPDNRNLWRLDGSGIIRAPLSSLSFLPATASANWRVTHWQQSYDPVSGLVVPVSLTRQMLELHAQVTGPILSRVFQTPGSGYAERFKHVIEPSFSISRTTPFRERSRVILNDGTDSIVGGTTTVDYRLTNRLLARRKPKGAVPGGPAGPGIIREILRVEIGQSYYSDALASQFDPNYQSSNPTGDITTIPTIKAPGQFSPLQITSTVKPVDNASADFRMEIDAKYRALRTISASGSLEGERVRLTGGWSKRGVIPQLADQGFGLDQATHYLNAQATVHTRANQYGGTYDFNYDLRQKSFLQQRVLAYYNSQCCGLSVDWQSIDAPFLPNGSDRRFGVSFTLAGIGSFSNPFGSFGGGSR